MSKKILIVYGSKKGSTAEISDKIGSILKEKGYQVDVVDSGKVKKDLTSYSKIVIGSSVYYGLWHKKVIRFLKKNKYELEHLPVWIFISGPSGEGNPTALLNGWLYPKSIQPIIQQINPCNITSFGGKLSFSNLTNFEKWIIKNANAPEGDFRDWGMINLWANSIIDQS